MVPVELKAASAGYEGATSGPLRLEQVDLSVEAGELVAVLGPNGSGKTTLVRVISGLLRPQQGSALLFGEEASSLDRLAAAKLVAVVSQHTEVALGFTVREVVGMGRAPHQGAWQRSRREDEQAVARALAVCELEQLSERPVASLSGGEQKRTHIARALAQHTPILLLDEAGAHLDIRHAMALYQLVRAEIDTRKLACLAVMHDLEAAAQHADRVVLLKAGAVVAAGPVAEVMTAPELARTFDAKIHVGTNGPAGRRYFLPMGPSTPAPQDQGKGAE
jgi:iron complex transport system ATP-binding protein